jgi:phosphate-selective porin OprO/OprP
MTWKIAAVLLAGTALTTATPAFAQDPAPAEAPEPETPDADDSAADAVIANAQAVDDAQAKIELLQAQVESLQAAIEDIRGGMVKATPTWKGAPLYEDKDEGWSFKPRGRIQYDAGWVSNPDDHPLTGGSTGAGAGLNTRDLGFNTRARRIRLGAEGAIPGGFGYKFEMDFADSQVRFGDAIITYAGKGNPWNVAIGNQETLNGLEQITSSRFTSFMERAAFDDAFINTRRIGINAGYVNPANTFRINAGLFAAHSIDASVDNEGWIAAMRAVYSPMMGANQLHFGANFQYRKFQANNGQTPTNSINAPSTNQIARYRARPFTQTTGIRFVDTGNYVAEGDTILGLEAAGIFKSLHVAAEGQYLWSRVGYDTGDFFASNDLDQFVNNTTSGCGGTLTACAVYVTPSGNPSFWGGYVEAGYFFTGETRGYKNGLWDRTKVLKPFSKGGWGAIQANLRVDHLDLQSGKLKNALSNNFTTGTSSLSSLLSRSTRGGEQTGILASLVWIPEDYMRFYLQYSHAFIQGGPFADEVEDTSTGTVDVSKKKYGVDFVGTRAQIDF